MFYLRTCTVTTVNICYTKQNLRVHMHVCVCMYPRAYAHLPVIFCYKLLYRKKYFVVVVVVVVVFSEAASPIPKQTFSE